MSLLHDMGNKESIKQAQENTNSEMSAMQRDADILLKPGSSAREYKQNFQRVHNPNSNTASPPKSLPQPPNDQKPATEDHRAPPASSQLDRPSSMASSEGLQGGGTGQVREDIMPASFTALQQPMFNAAAYNSTVFSGQMIPPMLVQQPMQLPTAMPGMFQTGFMYPSIPQGLAKPASSQFFAPFTKGSLIMLATGGLKPIEELKTMDFIESANVSKQLCLETSTIVKIQDIANSSMSLIGFAVDNCDSEVMVEKPSDHPFFIYEHGWASCKPNKTLQHYGLSCQQLKIGDICVFLSNKQDIRSERSAECEQRHGVEDKERSMRHSDANFKLGSAERGLTGGEVMKPQATKVLAKKENEENINFGQAGGKKAKLDLSGKSSDLVQS